VESEDRVGTGFGIMRLLWVLKKYEPCDRYGGIRANDQEHQN
jgi:hypothetical protein